MNTVEHPYHLVSVILHEGVFYGFQSNGAVWSRSPKAGPKEPWTQVYDPAAGRPEKKIGLAV